MSVRVALVLLLVAAGLHFGVAGPGARDAMRVAEEFRRLRQERQQVRLRLALLERRETERRRAASVLASVPGAATDSLPAIRRTVVASLGRARVTDVRLHVQAGRPPARANVQVAAQGSFAELARLSGHLVRPGSGLILDQLRFAPAPDGLRMELQAMALEPAP